MKEYYGTKLIQATPMTRLEYNEYRGWDLPADENGEDAGYLVEYVDSGKQNHKNHKGYISWSPADVFETAYQPTSGMSFGYAIDAMKRGQAVARRGWNGKGMWVALTCGSHFDAKYARAGHAAKHLADEMRSDRLGAGSAEMIRMLPRIDMRAADGSLVVGWLASQTDMLADDWCVVTPEKAPT